VYDKRFDRFTLYKQGKKDEYSLSGTSVTSFTQDRNGNIWVSTDGGESIFSISRSGIFFAISMTIRTKIRLPTIRYLPCRRIIRADYGQECGRGMNYFKIDGNNLKLIKKYDLLDPDNPNSNCVFNIYFSPSGELWIGNYSSGIYKFDPATETFVHINLPEG